MKKRIHKNLKFDKNLALKYYLEKNDCNYVANKLQCGIHTVYRLLKQKGIILNIETSKIKKRIFKINENFFDIINSEEKAYWLGFLYADGYVNNKQGLLKIALHQQDENHLNKFLYSLESNYEIKEYRKGYKEIRIWSRTLINGLIKHGCNQAKSGTIKFPNFLNKELTRHFIRGYFDGDGGVGINSDNMKMTLSFTGLDSFLESISNNLNINLNINKKKYYKRKENSPQFGSIFYSGTNIISLICNYIYKDAIIFLDRKLEKIKDNLNKVYNKKGAHIKSKNSIIELKKNVNLFT